jgi:hypothetical protein
MWLVRRLVRTGALVSRRSLRWTLLVASSASCVGLVLLAGGVRRDDAPPPRVSLEPAALQGFRSASYEGDRLRLRISGDSLTVSHPKLFGPFSLGFVRAVLARNVTVETFPGSAAAVEPTASLAGVPALLAQQRGGLDIGEVKLAPIKVIEHRDGEAKVILTAASCSAGLGSWAIACKDGAIDRDGTTVRFHELSYDGQTKGLRATP